MGREIVYCSGCGKSLLESDFDKGKAHTLENRPYCTTCKPLEAAPPSARSSAKLSAYTPGPRPAAAPAPKKSPIVLPAVIGVAFALAVILVVIGTSRNKPPGPSPTPEPPIVERPPAPPPEPPPAPPPPRILKPEEKPVRPPDPPPVVPPPPPVTPPVALPPPPPTPPKVDPAVSKWQAAMALATDRDYAAAIDALKGDADAELVKKVAAMVQETHQLLAKWPRGEKIALDVLGADGKLERIEGVVERSGPFRLEIKRSADSVRVEMGEIAARSLAEIYRNRPGKRPDADGPVASLLCLLEGDVEAANADPATPERFARYAAPPRADAEPRRLFAEADAAAMTPRTALDASQKLTALLNDHASTGFVRRNRASIASLIPEIGREYVHIAGDVDDLASFVSRKYLKSKLESCWVSERDLEPGAKDVAFISLSFGALPDAEYRCWVWVGGCCAETLSFSAQATDQPAPVPVKPQAFGLKSKHAQHTGPKEPLQWSWVAVPLPKFAAPGVKSLRLTTTQKGFGFGCAIVTSLRRAPPKDAELKDLERSRLSIPAQNVLSPDDLVAYWKFDEGSGGTVADASGKGHAGWLKGDAKFGPGRSGMALVFSGTGYVEVADAADLTPASMTWAAWVNLPVEPPKGGNFISKGKNDGVRYRAVEKAVVQILDRGATNVAQAAPPLPLNQWAHVAVTGDATGLKIYINGVLSGSSTMAYGAARTGDALNIGAESSYGEFVIGSMDEVCLFKKALTPPEIQSLYRLGPKVASK
jgi:hypothetical protein